MKPETDIDRIVEIERLAALELADYEAVRIEAAKRLNYRATVLDRFVKQKRRALGVDTGQEDGGQGRAVKIKDVLPWPDPVDGDIVATSLAMAVTAYAVLPDTAADAIALWVLHTWLVNKFTISPRLAITSPTKGCGKTTVLRFLNIVSRRPKRAGSISPSALFRVVEQFQPTIVLDETEKYIEQGGDLHALINEGHCKGATVLRVLGDKLELREFAIFGAVTFARNGKLPDDLEQRSIVIEMQRRLPGESLIELREDRCDSLQSLTRMCAAWAETADLSDYDPDMGRLINRTADNWRPLFAIGDAIGSDWPERVRAAAAALAPRESESSNVVLLADIKAVFEDKQLDRLASVELCDALTGMEGKPWAEWRHGKPLTPNQLARLLKSFRILPDSVRIGDRTPKGYHRHQFAEMWQRYLATQGVTEAQHRNNPDKTGTSVPFQGATCAPDVAAEKREKSPPNGHCCSVAVDKPDNAPVCADTFADEFETPDGSIPSFLRRGVPKNESQLGTLMTDEDERFIASGDFK